jgi:molybdopterin synthase catalytic subunit
VTPILQDSSSSIIDPSRISVSLVVCQIDSMAMLARATRPSCGSVLLFLGTTRQWTGEEETESLFYEAYGEMALHGLSGIASDAVTRWGLEWVEIVHRLGRVAVSEASVAVVVASPHRKESFAAGEWIMERLKADVPIWKRDHSPNDQRPQWQHPL